jgi:hypothetical protein
MKTRLIFAAALLAAAPVHAQDAAPAPGVAPAAEVDPQRLALARLTVQHVFPAGTYERMMKSSMDTMLDNMMASMFDMQMRDLLPEGSPEDKAIAAEVGAKTMRELVMAEDPHFEERMTITNRVMMTEMIPIMTRLEPDVREGLARAYARRFDAAQLGELNRFFATPAGGAYASESLMLWMDPEIMGMMGKFVPEMIKEMPAVMEKVAAATAHLPPPPADKAKGKSDRKNRR